MLKEDKQSAVLLTANIAGGLMSASYVCGFSLMKNEYREINAVVVVVLFARGGRKSKKKTTVTFSCLILLPRGRPHGFESSTSKSEGE